MLLCAYLEADNGGRSIQIFNLSKRSNTTVKTYSVTSKSPAFKMSQVKVQKYYEQNLFNQK